MLSLYQAEWCPYSHRVRQRWTELGLPFVALPVEPWPEERHAMREATGEDSIPTLVTEDGEAIQGDRAIIAWLDGHHDEPATAEGHREQARAHE